MSAPLARDWRDQPPAPTARHCPVCGTFHDELRACPDLVPGYTDSPDGRADLAAQARWDRRAEANFPGQAYRDLRDGAR